MKVAFIVLAHHLPRQLASLLSTLRHEHVRVYLHIDRRKKITEFTEALREAGVQDVDLLPRRATRWGGIEMVDASLDGLVHGIADGCGYFLLISGQDVPLRPVEAILHFAEDAGDRSYLDSFPLPTRRWRFEGRDRTDFYTYNLLGRRETCIPRGEDVGFFNWKGRVLNEILRLRTALEPPRSFPSYVRPFGGWQWWNLSRAAAEYVLDFLDHHPDYRRYHRHTLAPDELFFQSILLGTDFGDRHAVVNDALRFMVWQDGASHPRTLMIDDLPVMLQSGKLFARKVDARIDDGLVMELANRFAV